MRKRCLLRKLVWLRSVEGMLELGRERRIKEDGDSWREREREREALLSDQTSSTVEEKKEIPCLSVQCIFPFLCIHYFSVTNINQNLG